MKDSNELVREVDTVVEQRCRALLARAVHPRPLSRESKLASAAASSCALHEVFSAAVRIDMPPGIMHRLLVAILEGEQ